jgi:hypothetical protein
MPAFPKIKRGIATLRSHAFDHNFALSFDRYRSVVLVNEVRCASGHLSDQRSALPALRWTAKNPWPSVFSILNLIQVYVERGHPDNCVVELRSPVD